MRLDNQKARSTGRHNRCMFLLLVPVFFFSASLYMGKRAKNSGYTKLGIFYGISSLVTFVISALGLVWPVMLYGLISHFIVWVLCTIHTLNCREKYSQYAQWALEDTPERSELVYESTFRRRNRYWLIWDCVPLMGGFATYFMGARMNKPVLKWIGAASTALVAALFFWLTSLEQVKSGVLTVIAMVIAYCSICVHPLLSGFFFEEYLDAAATQWQADVQEYPRLESAAWRFRNSLWQVLTFVPYFGSMGLFWAGITRESGKTLGKATCLFLLEMACMALPGVIATNMPHLEGIAVGISSVWVFVYGLIIFTGASIRRQMLCIRAEQDLKF